MTTIIHKNILDVDRGIICHQTNCVTHNVSGLAKAIMDKWPGVREVYHNTIEDQYKHGCLGYKDFCKVGEDLFVVNLYGQFNTSKQGQRATNYAALGSALWELYSYIKSTPILMEKNYPVYFPYKLGCGLGRGDWKIVYELINDAFPNSFICKLEE